MNPRIPVFSALADAQEAARANGPCQMARLTVAIGMPAGRGVSNLCWKTSAVTRALLAAGPSLLVLEKDSVLFFRDRR
jgi:hypothetical protein